MAHLHRLIEGDIPPLQDKYAPVFTISASNQTSTSFPGESSNAFNLPADGTGHLFLFTPVLLFTSNLDICQGGGFAIPLMSLVSPFLPNQLR